MRIKSIKLQGNEEIQLNNFTVLVGPNNVGKSTVLRDISNKMVYGPNARPILLENINFEKPKTWEFLVKGLECNTHPDSPDYYKLTGISHNLRTADSAQIAKRWERDYANLSMDEILRAVTKLKVAYLDASSRLEVAKTVNSSKASQAPQNLLQLLYKEQNEDKELQAIFKRAFNMEIRFDYSELAVLTFKVTKVFPHIPDDPRAAYSILSSHQGLDEQGDGFRSFVGVILSILLCKDRIILLDEPEAFLHPTQAKILGGWIGRKSKELNGQILVATHNSNFLAGIMSSGADADIFRLNRIEDNTTFHKLGSKVISGIVNSPLLSSQPVLESIFHRGVAVCEGDSDRVVYQTVALKEFENEEILFIHAHSKQAIKDVVKVIKPASIPVCAIVDLDILKTETDFKDLILSFSNNPDDFISSRNRVAQVITRDKTDKDLIRKIMTRVRNFSNELTEDYALNIARIRIKDLLKELDKWDDVKDKGTNGLPYEVQKDSLELVNGLMSIGIFVVPVGELEGWIHTQVSKRKKNLWIVEALEKLARNECPDDLRTFVNNIIEYLKDCWFIL